MPDKLIKYKQQDLDLDKYVYNLAQNVESWVNTQNWNDSQKEEFWKAYELYKTKLQEVDANNYSILSINDKGSIIGPGLTNVDTDDYYYDQSGNRISRKDYSELAPKKQQRYNNFEANKQVAKYLNVIAKAFSEAKPKEKVKEPVKQSFEEWFQSTQGISALEDFNYFLELDPIGEGNLRNTNKRVELLVNDILPKYVKTLSDEDKQKYQDLKTHLTTNGLDAQAKLKMLKLGISSNFFESFFSPYEKLGMTPESYKTWLTQQEQKAEQEEKIEKEKQEVIEKEKIQEEFQSFAESLNQFEDPISINIINTPFENQKYLVDFEQSPSNKNLFNLSKWEKDVMSEINTGKYENINDLDSWVNYWVNASRTGNFELPRHILYALLYNSGIPDKYKGKSVYRIKADDDLKTGKTLIWDPGTSKLEWIPLRLSESGDAELQEYFKSSRTDLFPQKEYKFTKYSKGGLLKKLQFGGFTENYNKQIQKNASKNNQSVKEYVTNQDAFFEDMSWEDWVDLGSLTADLGSAIFAQVPGWGTVTSAGLGLASSASQMVTDVSRDGLDKRDVKNLLTNVGFDLFGLVPGAGLTAKSGKLVKKLVKWAPRVMALYSGYSTLKQTPEIMKAWGKVLNNEELTLSDIQAIQLSLKALTTVVGGKMLGQNQKQVKGKATYEFYDALDNHYYKTFSGQDAKALGEAVELGKLNHILGKYKDLDGLTLSQNQVTKRNWYGKNVPVTPEKYKADPIKVRKYISPSGKVTFYDTKTGNVIDEPKLKETTSEISVQTPTSVQTTASPKKKKINKKALGGFISKLQNGNVITNTTNNGANWFKHMFDTKAMQNYLNTINLSNYTQFNDLQNSWYNNKVASKYQVGQPSVTYLNSVKTRQGLFNTTGLNDNIKNALTKGFLKQAGTSGDNFSGNWQDGYFGEQEYLRHAGTVDSWKGKDSELYKTIEMFAKKGLKYAPNENGMYILSPISNQQSLIDSILTGNFYLQPKKSLQENNVSTQSDIPVTSKTETELGRTDSTGEESETSVELPKQSYLNRFIPYSMAFGRSSYADNTNRRITDLAKSGEKPFLMDPFTYNRYVQGNLSAINLGDLEAAQLANIKTPYADATLNFAAKLEGFNRGLDRRRYGRMVDDQTARQSYEQVYQQGKENALNEHETGLKNRLSIMQSEANKNKYEQAYLAKKHEIWDTLGKEVEYDVKTLLNDRRDQQEVYNRRAIDSAIRYNLKKYMPNLSDESIKVWDGVNSGTLQLDYNNTNQMNLYKQAQQAYTAAVYNALGDYARLKTYPIPFTKSSFSPKLRLKQGGAIKERIANAERLFKTIKSDLDRNEKKLTRLYKSLYTLKNKVK